MIYKVCQDVGHCVKNGSCSSSNLIQWSVVVGCLTILTMLAVIKHTVDNNVVFQQHNSAPANGARNSSTATAQHSQLPLSCRLQQSRAELNQLQD